MFRRFSFNFNLLQQHQQQRLFSIVGSETRELSSDEIKKLYSRPENVVSSSSSSKNSSLLSATTGPLLDLSLVGVVKNTQVGPSDDQSLSLKCEIATSWISPSRGAVADFLIDKQVFRVNVRGKKYLLHSDLFRENSIVYCHGRLILKPVFDSNNFRYQYFPELILTDEFGWAECLLYEKVEKREEF
jgi:hypothetical protein